MISLIEVTKIYDGNALPAVDRLSFEVPRGSLAVLLGESGCGKTTTLKMINRLIEPTRGKILVDHRDHAKEDPVQLRRSIGYVFQDIGLFPHMTIAQNVAAIPRLLHWTREETDARVDQLLEVVGLPPSEYRNRYPSELSGGQQQRVGLARALAVRPALILMDEPFGALDPLTRAGLREEFLRIHNRLQLTTLMVTHDVLEALIMADRIIVMKAGKLVQQGTAHELLTAPTDPYVEELMKTPKTQLKKLETIARG